MHTATESIVGPIGVEEIAALIAPPRGGRVLDIGSGKGNLLSVLERSESELVGMDPWPKMVSESRHRLARADIVIAVGESLSFRSGSFDRVNATFVLEHVRDQDVVLREISRILAPGGRMIIGSPNASSPYGMIVASIPIRLRNAILSRIGSDASGTFSFEDETVHYRYCSIGRLDRVTRKLSFKRLEVVWSTGLRPLGGRSKVFSLLFGTFWRVCEVISKNRSLAWMAPHFYAVYEKRGSE